MEAQLLAITIFALFVSVVSSPLLFRRTLENEITRRVQILVLGDIGRSPRMRNHATSFARQDVEVDLVGYVESELPAEIQNDSHITVHRLPASPHFLQTTNRKLFMVLGPVKVLHQILFLILKLLELRQARWMVVQNPPSIPTLVVAALVCSIRGTRLVIDWHNYGYSILALKLGQKHPLVQISYGYEKLLSSFSSLNFTVSEAMSKQLGQEFGIKAPLVTLHDRPTALFQPITDPAKRLEVLAGVMSEPQRRLQRRGQVRVLASSTSWTADEDFSILLDALVAYSALTATGTRDFPYLCVIITGKGPQKDYYIREIAALQKAEKLKMVSIQTPWFPSVADYANSLGSADLGVSLHMSSSGVDLPMKVVDMLGAGLPVVGWSKYESWPELIQEGRNGRGFQSTEALTDILVELMGGDGKELARLREGALLEGARRWEQEWDERAAPSLGLESDFSSTTVSDPGGPIAFGSAP